MTRIRFLSEHQRLRLSQVFFSGARRQGRTRARHIRGGARCVDLRHAHVKPELVDHVVDSVDAGLDRVVGAVEDNGRLVVCQAERVDGLELGRASGRREDALQLLKEGAHAHERD